MLPLCLLPLCLLPAQKLKKPGPPPCQLDTLRAAPTPPTPAAASSHQAHLSTLASTIEADHNAIDALLKRRVYVRHCMWSEMLFLFRSTSLLKATFRKWVAEEVESVEGLGRVWKGLEEELV